jgi:hypothetical protein
MGMFIPKVYSRTMVCSPDLQLASMPPPVPPNNFGDMFQNQFVPSLGNLPKVPFPGFDGDNPKLWQLRCHDYFTMYSVDPRVWIKIATMYFTGAAARWLQSVEYQLAQVSWVVFGHMVVDRFGKGQHAVFIRQLFHIKQTTTVTDYAERFSQLIDQLHAYSPHADPLYYTMRFVDGLRDDIKSIVLVQRPRDVDTAVVLAQLQEEVANKKRDYRKFDVSYSSKNLSKSPLPLPLPPKAPQLSKPDDSTTIGATKVVSTDDKLASLMAYQKAKGLCYKCGLPYTRGHHCADNVQLPIVEELWQMIHGQSSEDDKSSEELNTMSLSQAAAEGFSAPKTMQFVGHIQGWDLLIQLDSDSSHSFLSTQVAAHVTGLSQMPQKLSVKVANGSVMNCSQELLGVVWSLSCYEFKSNLRVLPLQTYDLIIGMDWLEMFSPMMVHWYNKWLLLPYKGSWIKLMGL